MGLAGSFINERKGAIDLRDAAASLDSLPAMPLVAQKLLTLDLSTEEGERNLLMLVEQDPFISARLIGLANSPLLAPSRRIMTVREAATLLGFKRVRSVSFGIAFLSLMNKRDLGRFSLGELWMHSLAIAFGVLEIAKAMPAGIRPEEDMAFLGGMLHDIGYLALAHIDRASSDMLHSRLEAEPTRPAREIEQRLLPVCHDELGSILAMRWGLPAEIVSVLRYHHTPHDDAAVSAQPLVLMVSVVERLLPTIGMSECVDPGIDESEWLALGISDEHIVGLTASVVEQAEQAAHLLGAI